MSESLSVIIVSYNSQRTLPECLAHVLAGLGPRDEVVVVDNASTDATPAWLRRQPDPRLRLVLNERNLGFAAACNLGARRSSSHYLLFLNPDVVPYGSWRERLRAPLTDPEVGAVGPVSDYVAGIQKWQLYAPSLAADAAREAICEYLETTQHGRGVETRLLIGMALALRREVFEQLGGMDEDLFLGNDDLDLSWRLRLAGYKLLVVPGCFVHHLGQESFKTQPASRTRYLVAQSANLLQEKLWRHYGPLPPSSQELWGMDWFQPSGGLTSVVVLCHNQLPHTQACLTSLLRWTPWPLEVLAVDNGSTDGTGEFLRQLARIDPRVRPLHSPRNLGFAGGNNLALRQAAGDYLVLLNNDTVVTPGWLARLLAAATDPAVGMAGPSTNLCAGLQRLPEARYANLDEMVDFARQVSRSRAGELSRVNRLVGFCLLFKRDLLDKIGGLDVRFATGNYEDDDFCLRAALAGSTLLIAHDTFVHHEGGASFGGYQDPAWRRAMEENRRIFQAKWSVPFNPEGTVYDPAPALRQAFSPDLHYAPLALEHTVSEWLAEANRLEAADRADYAQAVRRQIPGLPQPTAAKLPVEVTLRPVREQDAPWIVDHFNRVAAEGSLVVDQALRDAKEEAAYIVSLSPKFYAYLVVEYESKPAGLLFLSRGVLPRMRHLVSLSMSVEPPFRRRGIGTAMLQEAERWAKEQGATKLILSVLSSNEPALALYHKFGFFEEGRRPRQFRNHDGSGWDDEILMGKLMDQA